MLADRLDVLNLKDDSKAFNLNNWKNEVLFCFVLFLGWGNEERPCLGEDHVFALGYINLRCFLYAVEDVKWVVEFVSLRLKREACAISIN